MTKKKGGKIKETWEEVREREKKKRKKEKIHVEELVSLKLGPRSPISGNALSDVEEVLDWIGSRGMELCRSLASLDGDITLITWTQSPAAEAVTSVWTALEIDY
jgi:hypothetical protein